MTSPAGDGPAELFDRHAARLYRLACAVLGSRADAEIVVTDVMSQACNRPRGHVELTGCELAHLVIDRCQGCTYPPGRAVPVATAVWALCVYGGCTVRETAAVLGLSQTQVHGLLTRAFTARC